MRLVSFLQWLCTCMSRCVFAEDLISHSNLRILVWVLLQSAQRCFCFLSHQCYSGTTNSCSRLCAGFSACLASGGCSSSCCSSGCCAGMYVSSVVLTSLAHGTFSYEQEPLWHAIMPVWPKNRQVLLLACSGANSSTHSSKVVLSI